MSSTSDAENNITDTNSGTTVLSQRSVSMQLRTRAGDDAKPLFVRYLEERVFSEPHAFFETWPLDRILREEALWSPDIDSKWFYIIYNNKYRLTTFVGCTHDIGRRFAQHRGTIKGCPPSTRQAMGSWLLVACVRIAPISNWHVDELKRESQGKGIALRTQRLLQFACTRGFEWYLARECFDSSHLLYMPDVLALLQRHQFLENASVLAPHLMGCLEPPNGSATPLDMVAQLLSQLRLAPSTSTTAARAPARKRARAQTAL